MGLPLTHDTPGREKRIALLFVIAREGIEEILNLAGGRKVPQKGYFALGEAKHAFSMDHGDVCGKALSKLKVGYNRGVIHLYIERPTMAAEIGYCVKCREKREMKDAKEVEMKGGRRAMKGVCSVCGTGMYKILGKAK